jgi:hypothetical protein
MTDHLSFEQLCDFADRVLSPAAAAAADAHLRTCEECTMRVSAISALAASTAALPREVSPPPDLWSDIRKELKPRYAKGNRGARVWRVGQLAAAAVIIAVASSGLTVLILRGRGTARPTQSAVAPVATQPEATQQLPARLASAESRYTHSVEMLQRTLDERRDSLAPSTVATVERSLRIADSAIAEARDALARDPANRALAALFASNYERKIDLLRRATELAPRT